MPEGRFAGIVILAEDNVHARFIRSWLTELVFVSHRDIRDVLTPSGAGEQFVRKQFPFEVESHRRISKKRGSMLIAVIDADTGDCNEHYRELLESAPACEGVFVFVPKRHIETWLQQLNGEPANETDSYKLAYRSRLSEAIPPAGRRFLELVRGQTGSDLLPSLASGVVEAREMPRLREPKR